MSLIESHADSGLAWRKATASAGNGACVEVAPIDDGGVAVRDSKDPGGPILRYTAREWEAFLIGAKQGEFDL
ncbi:MAG TPA: DUF397 domain-containing protein [Mycobacterium sp.]|nr:DUF397 domain-containing protein [Mycobacterium sp.]